LKKLLAPLILLVPFMAIADEPGHEAICKKLRPDITRSYEVFNLVLIDSGSSYSSEEGRVLCVYDGIVQKFYGERAVRVMATLNTANNKLNVLF